MQDFLVIIILVSALSYLGYRLYKTLTKKKCDNSDCGCK
ncbi:MAG: FeoB-associated Cys-rich membrane protein [Bacteroidia bacterium]|nr:FeoB-associated Cys-rich membrane protein [Bacteroidia bacterium]